MRLRDQRAGQVDEEGAVPAGPGIGLLDQRNRVPGDRHGAAGLRRDGGQRIRC